MTSRIGIALLLSLTIRFMRGQDPLTQLPANYRLVFENEWVGVVYVKYLPHQKPPVHNHPDTPAVYVYLTNSGPVRFSH